MGGDDNVKVAVRVRPFNQREMDRNAKLIIKMEGPKTYLTNPETGKVRDFTFDFSYWSHNKDDAHFATQKTVFQDLGVSVLDNAWKGYNCSLLAYGQTGSGKSYSMVGYGEDKGIIPIASKQMFERIADNQKENTTFKVETSMLEIYNERIKDLYNIANNPKGGLKVREHPKTGPYVDGLQKLAVSSFNEIDRLMEEGTKGRTIASTNMNATSSRAHTIFSIVMTQTSVNMETKKATDRVAKINLVDLAGSERVASTGAEGDRLKEGANINRSLSVLGNCINSLAKGDSRHVPFRDSVLTWILRESLGGNAKTIMIAAISPADINFDETLSTLRYADRAKQIKTKAIVNEDPNEKLIRSLKDEIEQLKAVLAGGGGVITPEMLAMLGGGGAGGGGGLGGSGSSEVDELRRKLMESERLMREQEQTWEEKLKETQQLNQQRQKDLAAMGVAVSVDRKLPHLINLNEDPSLSENLLYYFKKGVTTIGSKNQEKAPDIALAGLSIDQLHATVTNADGKVIMEQKGDSGKTFVNGKQITKGMKVELHQGDRVIIGQNHIFRMNHPEEYAKWKEEREARGESTNIDYEYAMKEMADAQIQGIRKRLEDENREREERMKKEMESLQSEMERQREEDRKALERQEKEFKLQRLKLEKEMKDKEKELISQAKDKSEEKDLKRKLKQMELDMKKEQKRKEEELKRQQKEFEENKKQLEKELEEKQKETERLMKEKEAEDRERMWLEDELVRIVPLINEANSISEAMNKNMDFGLKVLKSDQKSKAQIAIKVHNRITDIKTLWMQEKFMNRIYLMREQYINFMETGELAEKENDAFYDPPSDEMIGRATIYLESLAWLIDVNDMTPVFDYKGKEEGQLVVEIIPRDGKGGQLSDDLEEIDELKGKLITLLVKVNAARGLPIERSSGVFVKFNFWPEGSPVHKTKKTSLNKRSINPNFGFEKEFRVKVDDEFIEWLRSDAAVFEVWGRPPEDLLKSNAENNAAAAAANPSSIAGTSTMVRSTIIQDMQQRRKSTMPGGAGSMFVDGTLSDPAGIVNVDLLIDVDLHEVHRDGSVRPAKMKEAEAGSGKRAMYKLHVGCSQHVVITLGQRGNEPLVVESVDSVKVVKVQGSLDPKDAKGKRKKTDFLQVLMLKSSKVVSENGHENLVSTAVWDPHKSAADVLQRKSKKGERVLVTVEMTVKMMNNPPVKFQKEILLKMYPLESADRSGRATGTDRQMSEWLNSEERTSRLKKMGSFRKVMMIGQKRGVRSLLK